MKLGFGLYHEGYRHVNNLLHFSTKFFPLLINHICGHKCLTEPIIHLGASRSKTNERALYHLRLLEGALSDILRHVAGVPVAVLIESAIRR